MGKNNFKLGFTCCLFFSCLMILNCKKVDNSDSNRQGLQNPSFENGTGIDADHWGGTAICPGGCCAQAVRTSMSGPGFMPTNGSYYMTLQYNSYCGTNPNFYQDQVDLSMSTKMIIDYKYSGVNSTCSGYNFYILFSADGNVTLFHRTFSQTAVEVQNDTIKLPMLPIPGRLLFTITGPWNNICHPTLLIDNIRLKK